MWRSKETSVSILTFHLARARASLLLTTVNARLADPPASKDLLSPSPSHEPREHRPTPLYFAFLGSGDTNSDTDACTANILLTGPPLYCELIFNSG